MRTVPSCFVIAAFFCALGLPAARGEANAPTVFLSSQAPTERIHGVKELSLITAKGKVHPCAAKLGDNIELLAMDLDLWLDELRREGHITTKRDKEEAALKAGQKGEVPVKQNPDMEKQASGTAEKAEAPKKQKSEPEEHMPKPVPKAESAEEQNPHIEVPKPDHGRELIEEMLPRMVLVLDGKAMTSLHPIKPSEDYSYVYNPKGNASPQPQEGRWFSVQFQFVRERDNENSKADWKDILKQSGVRLPMDVTLGIIGDDGKTIYGSPSYVTKGAEAPEGRFILHRVPWDGWTATGTTLLFTAFALFIYLALSTSILRDPAQPVRADGLSPVSLGRCQMAFWFFLVAGAFVFLWLVTGRGDLDTITDSTLVLLGISAGTALGAAFVPDKNEGGADTPVVNYRADLAAAKQRLLTLKNDRAIFAKTPDSAGSLETNGKDIQEANAALRKGEENLAAYRRANPHQFLTDLLSEDGKTVTFHRFQVVGWTLVLGIVFVSEVLTRLAMPTFSSTLLLLMGISSGTYIGFKFTPNKPSTTP